MFVRVVFTESAVLYPSVHGHAEPPQLLLVPFAVLAIPHLKARLQGTTIEPAGRQIVDEGRNAGEYGVTQGMRTLKKYS